MCPIPLPCGTYVYSLKSQPKASDIDEFNSKLRSLVGGIAFEWMHTERTEQNHKISRLQEKVSDQEEEISRLQEIVKESISNRIFL